MSLEFFPSRSGEAAFRAKWIMASPDSILENACLETLDGRVKGISKGRDARGRSHDLGEGLIMPLLVNAHTHLELSALRGMGGTEDGFEAWVKRLIARREALGEALLADAAQEVIRNLPRMGTGTVAEISTLGLTLDMVRMAGLDGIWFQEVLGGRLPQELLKSVGGRRGDTSGNTDHPLLSVSLAGHAPHTTAPGLLRQIREETRARGLPFSIHLAESEEEQAFIRGEPCAWALFLAERGIDTRDWPIGSRSPVAYLDALGILGPSTLAVHLIGTDDRDLDLLADRSAKICLCPRSNMNLHRRLPRISAMLARGMSPALGTDSLASCDSLSLFDEMAFVRKNYPDLAPRMVLSMASVNGAAVLGLARYVGRLERGCRAGFLYIDLNLSSCDDILESLTNHEF